MFLSLLFSSLNGDLHFQFGPKLLPKSWTETEIVDSYCQKTCSNENAEIPFVITHAN